jgi:replicative DNA helicase
MNQLFDIETEHKVLGQIIIEPDAFVRVSEILNVTDFYDRQNSEVYDAICDVFKGNRGIDILTVINELKKNSNGINAFEVSKLMDGVASAAHVEHHAKIIKDFSVRRKLLKEIERLKQIGESFESDLDDFIDKSAMFVDKVINEVDNRSQIKKFDDNVNDAIESIQEMQNPDSNCMGVKTSLATIRNYVPIWGNGDLIVIAARPGMGKTAFAIHELLHISQSAGPVLFFSLEMSAIQLTNRILQRESNLSRYDFDKMTPEKWTKLDNATANVSGLDFFIDDTPGVSISHIKAKAKIFKKQHNIKAIAVDYVQLMTTDKNLPREQQVAEVSRSLKLIAKEMDVPIFMVAQLNRGPESRKEDAFRPRLSDLRESGAIEQDADVVIFPHRPSYYLPDDPDFEGIAELIFPKNRHGKTGIAEAKVNETVTKFYDIAHGMPDGTDQFVPVNDMPY